MVCVVLCVCVRFCDALRVFLWTSCVSLWLLSLCSSGWQPMSEVRPGRGELRQRCSLDRCNAKAGGSRSLHDAGLGHATFCTGVEIPLSLTTLATSLSFFLFFFFWFFPRGARRGAPSLAERGLGRRPRPSGARLGAPRRAPRGKNQKKKKRKKEREVTRVVRERGISTQITMSFVASASSRVSRVNFAACRDLISACLSANFGAIRRLAF